MNEEMNRREAELNEAALESVSGGELPSLYERDLACRYCDHCSHRCGRRSMELAIYMHEHGDIGHPSCCPFLNP